MSRDYQPDEILDPREPPARPLPVERGPEPPDAQHRGGSPSDTPEESTRLEPREVQEPVYLSTDSLRTFRDRERTYFLRESEVHTLTELGKFRVIAADDLVHCSYSGNRSRMEREISSLIRQSLVQEKRFEISISKSARMFTLTKRGCRLLLKSDCIASNQAIYYGFVKPREAKHDADLYNLYQKESARIADRGGRVRRVILDYELKQKLNRDLARLGQEKDDPGRKREVAQRHGLQVVRGKIPVPDLRIEYETPEHGIARLDLELATRHYRPRQLSEKARAGFKLYTHTEDASRVRRILNDRELTAEILAL